MVGKNIENKPRWSISSREGESQRASSNKKLGVTEFFIFILLCFARKRSEKHQYFVGKVYVQNTS